MGASLRFYASESTFYRSSDIELDGSTARAVEAGKLQKGELIQVAGTDGEFKIIGRIIDKGRLALEVERMSDEFFKVSYNGDTYGVEAVSQPTEEFPGEYFVSETKLFWNKRLGDFESRTVGRWIPSVDCVRV